MCAILGARLYGCSAERNSGRICRVKNWRIPVVVVILVVAPAISGFSRSGNGLSSADDIGKILVIGVTLLVGLVVVVGLIAALVKTPTKPVSPQRLAQLQAEAKEFFDRAEAGQIQPPVTPLVLGAGEKAVLHEPSTLSESRATRGFAGAGTRIEGVYVGGGGSRYFQSLREVDSGTLTLTTQRLVFTGALESRVLDLKKDLVAVNTFGDTAIEVSTKRAKRLVFAVRNPIIWGALLRTMGNGDVLTTTKPVASSTDIRFNCPRCNQLLTVEQRGAGMAVNCPNCNEQIEIPHTTAAS
jgi:hypothetical protein